MKSRVLTALPLLLLCFAFSCAAPAQDIDKIVADAARDAAKDAAKDASKEPPLEPLKPANSAAPAPLPAPAAVPAPAQAGSTAPTTDNREMAEAIRSDLGEIDAAATRWSNDKKRPGRTRVTLKEIAPYLKADSTVATAGGFDRLGNPIDFGTIENGPHVASATSKALGVEDDFWGDYAPVMTKKEQAQITLAELKQLRLAILRWDTDNPDAPKAPVEFAALKSYLGEDSALWKREGDDLLGNPFILGTPRDPVHVSIETHKALGMPRDFWGEFTPKSGAASSRTVHRESDWYEHHRTFGRKVKDFFKGL